MKWLPSLREILAPVTFALLSGGSAITGEPNALTEEENAAGFVLLFNGQDLDGWKNEGNWDVRDGAIALANKGAALAYEAAKMPDDFDLRFEWKISPRGNSGIFYRPERFKYQILDDETHGDRINPRTRAGALYFCIAPVKDAAKPAGEWNTGRIVCKGSVIQHWMNGEKIVDFDSASPERAADMARLEKLGPQLTAPDSFPWLQNLGDPVWFRSIRLRPIPENEDIGHTPLAQPEIPEEALKKEEAILDRIQKNLEARKRALLGK